MPLALVEFALSAFAQTSAFDSLLTLLIWANVLARVKNFTL